MEITQLRIKLIVPPDLMSEAAQMRICRIIQLSNAKKEVPYCGFVDADFLFNLPEAPAGAPKVGNLLVDHWAVGLQNVDLVLDVFWRAPKPSGHFIDGQAGRHHLHERPITLNGPNHSPAPFRLEGHTNKVYII